VKDPKFALPALWVFVMFNYLYCDVISLFDSSVLKDVLAGHGSGGSSLEITPEFLLAASVLMEIPIAMTLLSRLLPYRANRWANVVAPAFLALVQVGSLLTGQPAAYYLFFSVIEVGTLAVIAFLALRWAIPQSADRVEAVPVA
jgi:hypothetical protein